MRGMIVIALLMVTACGSGQRMDEDRAGKSAKPPKTATLRGNPGIIHAMDQIPASERGKFQKALECEVRQNAAKRRPAIDVTPEFLTKLHDRLRADPKLATC